MKTIAITGICKNAGKTTVLNYLLSRSNVVNAITSIGLDGETTDNVFETKKPRIYVKSNTYIITAKNSLSKCDITYEVVYTTNIRTSMGDICIVRSLSEGYVLIAGPNKVSEINQIREIISNFAVDTLYVDGAINRKQFSSLQSVDEVHTVIGACFNQDINKTLDEVRLIKKLFSIDLTSEVFDNNYTLIVDGKCYDNVIIDLEFLKSSINKSTKKIYINSAINSAMIKYLVMLGQELDLIIEDSNKLFVNLKDMCVLEKSKINIFVVNQILLTNVYVNPVGRGYTYNSDEFKKSVSNIFDIEAIDVGGAYSEV